MPHSSADSEKTVASTQMFIQRYIKMPGNPFAVSVVLPCFRPNRKSKHPFHALHEAYVPDYMTKQSPLLAAS